MDLYHAVGFLSLALCELTSLFIDIMHSKEFLLLKKGTYCVGNIFGLYSAPALAGNTIHNSNFAADSNFTYVSNFTASSIWPITQVKGVIDKLWLPWNASFLDAL